MIKGLKRGTVILEDHQKEWEDDAKDTAALLKRVLGDKILGIEHIGSTAIPCLKAKPIIDILVGVKKYEDILEKENELKENGIFLRESRNEDELLLVMGDLEKDTRTHHIHAVLYGSKKWEDYLIFKDFLEKDEEGKRRYEKLKEELCKKHPQDRASYTAGKEGFIREAIEKRRKDMDERLRKQLAFALEIDKEKNIFRQTHLSGNGRNENDAEHAWHMAIMAYLLREYANEKVDIAKVMLMCLIHDIVEIDAGDTYAYDAEGLKTQKEREDKAKERIFSLLPEDQKKELIALFDEFEDYETMESKFAHSMDNLQPLLLNDSNEGGDWKEHDVSATTVYGRQNKTALGSRKLFEVTDQILQKHIEKGNLKK